MNEKKHLKIERFIINNLPKGFEETFQYGMISYVVPHSIYPNGYHVSPDQFLLVLPIKKTLLLYITWEFMQNHLF